MSRRRGLRPRKLRRGERRHRTPHDNVRGAAAWVVDRTLTSRSPLDVFLDSAAERGDPRDRGLLHELVLGTLRWRRRLDQVLSVASDRPLKKIEPSLHAPLRVAAYQLLFLDRVPAHAVVNEAVEQARCLTHRGGASFANAVLRRIARDPYLSKWPVREDDPIRRMAIELSHPDFLVRRWVDRLGGVRTRRMLEVNNRPRPMQLLAFRDRGGRELLAEALIDEGLEVEACRVSALGLTVRHGNPLTCDAFRSGDCYVQDEISQVAALLPPPQPGESILDIAAAPGGKSLALLAWEPDLRIVLADASPSRLALVRDNLRRLGRDQSIVACDALRPSFSGTFSRVVADLPCSGTGTLRKRPEIRWRLSSAEVDRLAAQGRRILEASVERVAPGGLLAIITCSLEREENEDTVAALLERHRELSPYELSGRLGAPLDSGIEGPGRWRFLPAGDHDGFTVHVLQKRVGPVVAIPWENKAGTC